MKNTFLIPFAMLVTIVSLSSCKKEYTCSCQQTISNTGYTTFGNYHPPTITESNFKNTRKAKKDDAVTFCNNFEQVEITTSNSTGNPESQVTTTDAVICELY